MIVIKRWQGEIPKERGKMTGIVEAMRNMEVGEYIELPSYARASAYSCARHVGIRVRILRKDENTIYVIRAS